MFSSVCDIIRKRWVCGDRHYGPCRWRGLRQCRGVRPGIGFSPLGCSLQEGGSSCDFAQPIAETSLLNQRVLSCCSPMYNQFWIAGVRRRSRPPWQPRWNWCITIVKWKTWWMCEMDFILKGLSKTSFTLRWFRSQSVF